MVALAKTVIITIGLKLVTLSRGRLMYIDNIVCFNNIREPTLRQVHIYEPSVQGTYHTDYLLEHVWVCLKHL